MIVIQRTLEGELLQPKPVGTVWEVAVGTSLFCYDKTEYAAYQAKLASIDQTPNDDKNLETFISRVTAAQYQCEHLYTKLLAYQYSKGLLGETATKQRNVDTAISPVTIPLKMGRVVAAAFAIRGITQATIDTHTPYITAAGLLRLRNALHDIVGLPPVNTWNE